MVKEGRRPRAGAVLMLAALAAAVVAMATPPLASGGVPDVEWHFVHGAGTDPGDNPINIYLQPEGGIDAWGLLISTGAGVEVGYGDVLDPIPMPAIGSAILLCPAVEFPEEVLGPDGCQDALNPGGTDFDFVEDLVLVAGFTGPGAEEVTVRPFTVDTSCVDPGMARVDVAHVAAMDELTLFIDGARDDRDPIANGEHVASVETAGAHDLDLLTVPDEFFALRTSLTLADSTSSFVAVVGSGDPTPEEPDDTDLRAITVAEDVTTCTVTAPSSTTSTTLPPATAPAPVPGPVGFTG
jgi:hypothetical protein